MKRITFTIAALSLCGLAFVSCKPSMQNFRDELLKDCRNSAAAKFNDPKALSIMNDYCICASEKITKNLSVDEIREMSKLNRDGKTAEFQAKLTPIVKPCIDERQKKMEASGLTDAPLGPTNAAPPANSSTSTPQ